MFCNRSELGTTEFGAPTNPKRIQTEVSAVIKKNLSALLVLYRTITEILSKDNGSAHCDGCAVNGVGLWAVAFWIAGWNTPGVRMCLL